MSTLTKEELDVAGTLQREHDKRSAEELKLQGTTFLATGAGVAAIGLAGAALGAVCPLCVIAAPAVAGFGLVQRLRAWRLRPK